MYTISKLFDIIKANGSVKQRKIVLGENITDDIKRIFNDTYEPRAYNISSFVPNGIIGELTLDNNYIEFHNAMNQIQRNEIQNPLEYLQEVVAKYDKPSQDILCNIIYKNLKIGLSYNSFLNVIGVNDARFKIAAFNEIQDINTISTDGTYYIMNKIYGVRCICRVERTYNRLSVRYYLEYGDVITTLNNLTKSIDVFTQCLGCGTFMLDGIIQIGDTNLIGDELQNMVDTLINGDEQIENPIFNIFDIMTRNQFEMTEESPNLKYRLDNIKTMLSFNDIPNINIVEHEVIDSTDKLNKWVRHSADCKCEGCMIRKNAIYKNNTKKDCLIYRHSK